jgi:flagellar hook-associated protein 3 FlgL
MRISTLGIFNAGVNAMLSQQSALAKTQQQVASGKRVQSAADDPVAAVQLQQLDRLLSQQQQFATNSIAATNRLQVEEQALADSTTLLQHVRDLVSQANSDTMTSADRQTIAVEIRSRMIELQSIANRRDSQGDFLFAGLSAATKPFVQNAGGAIVYAGDAGAHLVQLDSAVAVQDNDAGSTVFTGTPQGNGTFVVGANAANTGGGIIDTGTVVNAAAWVPGNYTLTFTSATAWQVTDSSSAVIAAGAYAPGGAINFLGVQVTADGAPAAGDSFNIAPAGTTDAFTALGQLVAALQINSGSESSRALLHTRLGAGLLQIDNALNQVANVRSQVGSRLALLDDVSATRDARVTDIQTSISQLRDLDYAAAVSKMNLQMVGLQAAQQSYSMISRLSLFNYL